MKKSIIAIIVLLPLGLGFYSLNLKSASPAPIEPKFFSPGEILPTDVVVKIKEDGFKPEKISIKEGTRVVFINESSAYAWPASDPHPIHTDYPEFDPKEPLKNEEAWASVFSEAGVWKYHDHLKPNRRGVVNVSAFSLISPEQVEALIDNGAPVLGASNAKATIVEFADFECQFCKKYYEIILPEIKKEFIDTGKAKFVFANFPILGQGSVSAASAARCALDQNKFWEYHDYLFEHQKEEGREFGFDFLYRAAEELDLDTKIFSVCFESNKYKKVIEEEIALGRSLGVTGTPTTYIGKNPIFGLLEVSAYLDKIKQEIELK